MVDPVPIFEEIFVTFIKSVWMYMNQIDTIPLIKISDRYSLVYKVIYPKYYKHCPYTVAYTTDCVLMQ